MKSIIGRNAAVASALCSHNADERYADDWIVRLSDLARPAVDRPSAVLRVKGQDFKRWRKSLGWSQKDAAEALGLKRRVVQYYEKGERGDQPVKIPRTVRLACFALSAGVEDYHGPAKAKEAEVSEKPPKKTKKHKEDDADRTKHKDGDKHKKKRKAKRASGAQDIAEEKRGERSEEDNGQD